MKNKLFIFQFLIVLLISTGLQAQTYVKVSKSASEEFIRHAGFEVSYNKKNKIPNYTAYIHTRDKELKKVTNRTGSIFVKDPDTSAPQAANADYKRSGYDRGHLAPAGDMRWSFQAMKESFYFTNTAPQNGTLNRGEWNKLEQMVSKLAIKYDSIYVITGVIIENDGKYIGDSVKVPGFFYKALARKVNGRVVSMAYLMRNKKPAKDDTYNHSTTTVAVIESMTDSKLFVNFKKIDKGNKNFDWFNLNH
ncbi:Nuclease [termite gut metagenome]|uniref:Nuclease n=1 Tax=termite gut metagenome TaxID=433724 RepID=A0A5J4STK4_9ZZZZ